MKIEQDVALQEADQQLLQPKWSTVSDGDQDAPTSTDDDKSVPSRPMGRCGIVQCRKSECNLKSHQQFAASRRRLARSKRPVDEKVVAAISRKQQLGAILDHSVKRIERQITNGHPAFPLKQENSPMFRELIHHYFEDQIDRLIQMYSPHIESRKYKSTMMVHAMSNDVFCMCIAANAKIDMLMRGHIRCPDRVSEIVQAATAHILRQKIESFRSTEVPWLLILVVALIGFDLAFDRRTALQGHHAALKQLTDLNGGLHNVGHIVQYIVNTDRCLACFLGVYPIFTRTPLLPQPPKHPLSTGPYGYAFQDPNVMGQIDKQVLDFCVEDCYLLRLMQTNHISLAPKTPAASDVSIIPYFLYLRDDLSCKGACLYAEYHENQNSEDVKMSDDGKAGSTSTDRTLGQSRCVLLATLIIDYDVAHANWYTTKVPFLAYQLKTILERQTAAVWKGQTDILIWILFVLAIVPKAWNDHGWAVRALRQQLSTKHKGKWPRSGWKIEQRVSLSSFVWCEKLNQGFELVCGELIGKEEQ